jgi:curved DNA-binding protein CbpA
LKKYFDILGLQEGASQEEIQEAYERLSDTLDPKKNDNLDFFIEEYGLVQEAYKFLKKEVKKTPESKQIAADSIESIFETYKGYDSTNKIDFLKKIEDKINSGSQNYKIALNIIFNYESCNNLELLFQKLKPTPKETPKEIPKETSKGITKETPKETSKGITKEISKPTKNSIKEKENSQKVIAVTDFDTSSTLIDKYNKAPKESKEGVLTLYKVLGSTGNKECLLALHELLGEPLDLDDNLLVKFVQGIASNTQASNKSFLKEGRGEFGLSKTNPIPVYGIPSNELYLKQLKTNSGGKITWKRKGSIKVKGIEKEIDEYLIYDEKGKKIVTFYISPYHWKTSKKFPKGFIHINEEPYNNKKSTEKSNPKSTVNPKLSKPQNQSKKPSSKKLKYTNKVLFISLISVVLVTLIYLSSSMSENNSSFPKKKSDIEIQSKAKADVTDPIFIEVLPKKTVKKRKKKIPEITTDSEYLNKLGIDLFDDGYYNNALIYFEKASELSPKKGSFHYNIGLTKQYLKAGTGCNDFTKALKYGFIEAQKAIDSYCNTRKNEVKPVKVKPVYVLVKGKIVDHKNRTLAGAKVTNKTTSESVSVNFDGEYFLKAKGGDIILFEDVKRRRYPDIETTFETSFGNIINVKFLTKGKVWSRLISKEWDSKYKAYSKTITSKYY